MVIWLCFESSALLTSLLLLFFLSSLMTADGCSLGGANLNVQKLPLHFKTGQVVFVHFHLTRYNGSEIRVSLSQGAPGFRIGGCYSCVLEYLQEGQMSLREALTLIIMLIDRCYTIHVLLSLQAEMWDERLNPRPSCMSSWWEAAVLLKTLSEIPPCRRINVWAACSRPSQAELVVGWFGLFNKINVKEGKVTCVVGVHFRTPQTLKKMFYSTWKNFS